MSELRTIDLFSGDFLNVDAPLLTVDCLDLTFSALESSTHDFDCVSFADGDSSYIILGSQILAQVAAHDLSSDVGGSTKVGLS